MKQDPRELFESAPIPKAFFALTVPTVLSKVVMIIYNLLDTWFIAATGDAALVAAISLCLPALIIMAAIGDIWGVGGSSLMSRFFGMGQLQKAKEVSALCFYGALICGIVTTAVMLLWEVPILRILGADKITMAYAVEYYRILAVGAPVIILCIVPMHMLRTEGMSTASMVGSLIGTIVHIILVPILIFGFHKGIAGAAWATVWGNAVNLFAYLWYMRNCKLSTISPKAFRFRKETIVPVLSIGIPSSLTTLMQSVAMTLTNRFLLYYGMQQVAAYGIASKLVSMANTVQVGFSFGAQPLLGYNYANHDHARLKRVLKFNYGFMTAISIAFTILLWIFTPQLMRLFMKDPMILSAGTVMTRYQLIGLVFSGIILVSTTVFRAATKPIPSFLLAVSRQGVVYALVLIAANEMYGYNGVIAAQPIADCITMLIALVLLKDIIRESPPL